jgi:hypothetical protein
MIAHHLPAPNLCQLSPTSEPSRSVVQEVLCRTPYSPYRLQEPSRIAVFTATSARRQDRSTPWELDPSRICSSIIMSLGGWKTLAMTSTQMTSVG